MMEQPFFENEFEQFLKENADQHRMYPSDGVWTNIYRHFHSGRRKAALATLLLLLLTGGILLYRSGNLVAPNRQLATVSRLDQGLPESGTAGYTASTVTVADIIEKLKAKSLIPSVRLEAPPALKPLRLEKQELQGRLSIPAALAENSETIFFPIDLRSLRSGSPLVTSLPRVSGNRPGYQENAEASDPTLFPALPGSHLVAFPAGQPEPLAATPLSAGPGARLLPELFDRANRLAAARAMQKPATALKNRWGYTMNFAPSIGYRNLFEGKTYVPAGNSPLMVQHMNVNQFVDHKPAIGFELGSGFRYQLTRSVALRTGFQLNLTRYSIAAFAHYPERTTLALNNPWGFRGDTLVATSNMRNLAGTNPERLHNQYLQVGIPVSLDWKLFGDQKLQVNLAGSLQPSYLINTNQYLLSSDFSNYVNEPSLLRRWNLATGLEASVSYQAGDFRWQVGPQFRYNLLSTYKKQYPIRENLMEYGLRIGFTKTIR